MSQIPISMIEQGQTPGRATTVVQRPRVAPTVPRAPIAGQLDVVGLIPSPAASQGAAQAAQLLGVLNMTGGIANQLAGQFRQTRIEREQLAAKNAVLHRGAAGLAARTSLPEWLQQIENRELTLPDDVSASEYVTELLDARLEGLNKDGSRMVPQAYADAYRQQMQPTLIAAFVDQEQGIKEQVADELDINMKEAGYLAKTQDDWRTIIEMSKESRPNITDTERLDRYVMPALVAAANSANSPDPKIRTAALERFDNGTQALGGSFPGSVAKLRQRLDENILAGESRQEAIKREDAENRFDRAIIAADEADRPINEELLEQMIDATSADPDQNLALRDKLNRRIAAQETTTSEAAENQMLVLLNNGASIRRLNEALGRLRPDLGEEITNQYRIKIDVMEAAERTAREKELKANEKTSFEDRTAKNAYNTLMSPGAGVPGIKDVTWVGESGTTYYKSASEQEKEATNTMVEVIKQDSETWQEAVTRVVATASSQGVTTIPIYKQILATAPMVTIGSFTQQDDKGKLEPPPKLALEAFELQRHMRALNPRFLDDHLDGNQRRFYEIANLSYEYHTVGDAAGSLMASARYMNRQAVGKTPIAKIDIDDFNRVLDDAAFVDGFWFWNDTATNRPEIAAELKRLADFYFQSGYVPTARDAIEKAATTINETHVEINGYVRRPIPGIDPLDQAAAERFMAAAYVKQYGENEGLDVNDLILIGGETGGTMLLVHAGTMIPVEHWREAGHASQKDILRFSQLRKAEANKLIDDKNRQDKADAQARRTRGKVRVRDEVVDFVVEIPYAFEAKLGQEINLIVTAGGLIDNTQFYRGTEAAYGIAWNEMKAEARYIGNIPGAIGRGVVGAAKGIGNIAESIWNFEVDE